MPIKLKHISVIGHDDLSVVHAKFVVCLLVWFETRYLSELSNLELIKLVYLIESAVVMLSVQLVCLKPLNVIVVEVVEVAFV